MADEGSWEEGSILTADSEGRRSIEWPGRFDRAMGGSESVAQTLLDQGPAAMRSEVKGRVKIEFVESERQVMDLVEDEMDCSGSARWVMRPNLVHSSCIARQN